ncbi:MAG TPA: diguanylate cyclase [Acidobacteriaceae bacterium]|jgi:two-component system cell cycle response regulator|nr:diguanylate cyclase [Acidobacteriaceae bacterium]
MKILLADDDPLSRHIMERMLRSKGYDVVTAENGRQALLELSRKDGPRLALLDWMMPELDGLGVCREIRAARNSSYTYILLLTARESPDDIVAGLKAGADDYLTKPCHLAELKARLHAGRRILMLEDELVESREAMRYEATHDALTSIWNRGTVLAHIRSELNLSRQSEYSTSLLLCDVDHFKQVNDTYGHLVGDEVLRQISSRLSSCIRSGDLIGRYGGEEFLVLLKGRGLKDRGQAGLPRLGQEPFDRDPFLHRAEQIRQVVRSRPFVTQAGRLSISVSIGAITVDPVTADMPVETLLARADEALYRAKAAGRDRAIFSDPPIVVPFRDELRNSSLLPSL